MRQNATHYREGWTRHPLLRSFLLALLGLAGSAMTATAQEEWERIPLPDASETTMTSVRFLDMDVGYATGYEGDLFSPTTVIFRTEDGGTTWEKISLDAYGSTVLTFLDADHIVGYSRDGSCSCVETIWSDDGGATWSDQTHPEINYAYSLQAVDEMTAVLTASLQDYSASTFWRTTDGGRSWEEYGDNSPGIGFDITEIDGDDWTGRYSHYVVRSTDAGMSWSEHQVSQVRGNGRSRDVTFLSDTEGILAAGIDGPRPHIFRTEDGGASWTNVYESTAYPYEMDNIAMINPTSGFAFAGDGTVLFTSDAGMSWEKTTEAGMITELTRTGGTLYAVGPGGLLQRRSVSAYIALPPQISSDVEKIDFGQVRPGDRGEVTVTITNNGGADLEITDIALSDDTKGVEITSAPDLPISFRPGLQINVTLRFSPDTEGDLSTSLQILSNDPSVPTLTIPVTGKATDQITSVRLAESPVTTLETLPHPLGDRGRIVFESTRRFTGSIMIHDAEGREVALLRSGEIAAGTHHLSLQDLDLTPGIYFCTIVEEGVIITSRRILR